MEKIGNTRERLPDGSLLCRDVPIARVGTMRYSESELLDQNGDQIGTSPDGFLTVHRDADELFRPETIRSFEGRPLTLKHPPVWVTPDTYEEYSKGHVRNVRPGESDMQGYLIADAVVMHRDAIDAIEKRGITEVSPGYDADYEPIEGAPGHYRQKNLLGNHLAIVERGRGGRSVRIGDEQGAEMAFNKKTWGQRLLSAVSSNDADGVEEAIRDGADEAPERVEPTLDRARDAETADPMAGCMAAISGLSDKLDALPALIAQAIKGTADAEGETDPNDNPLTEDEDKAEDEKAESETNDEAECMTDEGKTAPTGDAAFTFIRRSAVAGAEILSPGLKPGTMDSKARSKDKREAIDGLRRQALIGALADAKKAPVVRQIVGRRDIRAMTGDALFTAFNAATAAVKSSNRTDVFGKESRSFVESSPKAVTAADIQKMNRARFNR